MVGDGRDRRVAVEVTLVHLARSWRERVGWAHVERQSLLCTGDLERSAGAWAIDGGDESYLRDRARQAAAKFVAADPGLARRRNEAPYPFRSPASPPRLVVARNRDVV